MTDKQLESKPDYPTGKKYIEMLKAIGEISLERKKWKTASIAFEKERDLYENTLIQIESIINNGDDIYHDIEQIEAITHNALNRH